MIKKLKFFIPILGLYYIFISKKEDEILFASRNDLTLSVYHYIMWVLIVFYITYKIYS